jgi:hypothetical protein
LDFPTKIFMYFSLLMHAACPPYLILFDLITLIKFGIKYKLLTFSVCSFLHLPLTSLIGPNILFSTLFLNTLKLCF